MSAIVNGEFHLGETWVIKGTARDHESQPLNLTGSTILIRIATAKGVTALDLTTPTDGAVVNATAGTYEFVISPATQTSANVVPGNYKYEVKVVLSSGRVTIQNIGTITVQPSLFT